MYIPSNSPFFVPLKLPKQEIDFEKKYKIIRLKTNPKYLQYPTVGNKSHFSKGLPTINSRVQAYIGENLLLSPTPWCLIKKIKTSSNSKKFQAKKKNFSQEKISAAWNTYYALYFKTPTQRYYWILSIYTKDIHRIKKNYSCGFAWDVKILKKMLADSPFQAFRDISNLPKNQLTKARLQQAWNNMITRCKNNNIDPDDLMYKYFYPSKLGKRKLTPSTNSYSEYFRKRICPSVEEKNALFPANSQPNKKRKLNNSREFPIRNLAHPQSINPLDSNVNRYMNIINNVKRRYTKIDMVVLLQHYLREKGNLIVIEPINFYDVEPNLANNLQHVILLANKKTKLSNKTVVIPINLGRLYWVALYIEFSSSKACIKYLDPIRCPPPSFPAYEDTILKSVMTALDSVGINNLFFSTYPKALQRDNSCNCGTWLIIVLEYFTIDKWVPDKIPKWVPDKIPKFNDAFIKKRRLQEKWILSGYYYTHA